MELPRKQTRQLKLGSVRIGGGAPIVVQSMTNTDTRDVEATLGQIKRLHDAGCEIVRVAVPDETAARALRVIHDASPIPVIADIHFDYRLALMALEAGLEGLRINPGNIGERKNVEMVVDAAKARGAVIRVGVNSGSVEKRLLEQYGGPTPQAMVESALGHVRILEEHGFYDTKISIKSSSVLNTIECYRLLSQRCDYPLHLGVTEAGGVLRGAIKSSVGMGVLLSEGIGDTLRVSLTAAPEEEMTVAWELLRALGLPARAGNHLLPHLRAYGNRSHRPRSRSGAPPAHGKRAHQGRGHGLCGERTRRGSGSRSRHGGRPRQGHHLP